MLCVFFNLLIHFFLVLFSIFSLLNIIIIVSYIVFFFLSRIPHLEFGLAASPSLLQKHSLTGVTSFEAYVSDVIERRFEKVRIGCRFEDWMRLDVDLSLTYIYILHRMYRLKCDKNSILSNSTVMFIKNLYRSVKEKLNKLLINILYYSNLSDLSSQG